jgi:aminoglycoside 6'-N-acetyltransferase
VTLRGERVTLRPLAEADFPRLLESLRQPEVRQWWGEPYDDERLRKDYLTDDPHDTAFVILVGDEVVGLVTFWEEKEPDYRHAGMDIFIAPDRHGEGLGGDALRTLARHLVDDRGHHRLVIDPAVANTQAIRAYEKVGFRPVGVMRRAELSPDGDWRDCLLMDLLADELDR